MPEVTYVANSTGKLRKVLLCTPKHFSFQPINEITKGFLANDEVADGAAILREHGEFVAAYESAGVNVELIEAVDGLPYMVYARDFGACLAEGALIGSFREPVRQGEEFHFEAKLRELGVPIVGKIVSGAFEGGDFWHLDAATIVLGVVARTNWEGVGSAQRILEPLGYTVRGIQLASKNLHLDMAFNIVGPGLAVCATDQMPDFFLKMLSRRRFELIDVPGEGVFKHHCNVQCLGSGRVLSFARNTKVNQKLRAQGLEVFAPEITHILKGGGGPHCMTFPLMRDA